MQGYLLDLGVTIRLSPHSPCRSIPQSLNPPPTQPSLALSRSALPPTSAAPARETAQFLNRSDALQFSQAADFYGSRADVPNIDGGGHRPTLRQVSASHGRDRAILTPLDFSPPGFRFASVTSRGSRTGHGFRVSSCEPCLVGSHGTLRARGMRAIGTKKPS